MFGRARLHLTAWYAGALALGLLAIGTVTYILVRRDLDAEINSSLSHAAPMIPSITPVATRVTAGDERGQHESSGSDDEHESNGSGDDRRLNTLPSDVFFVVTSLGEVVSNPRRVNLGGIDFTQLESAAGTAQNRADVSVSQHRYRVLTISEPGGDPLTGVSAPAFLHIGRSLDSRDHQLRTIAIVLSLGGAAGVILSTAGGYWLAGRTLAPIRRSLEMQRRFVSDASHELRTPIATVKANNELLLRHHDQSVEANLDQVEAIATEADHMARLVNDLLTLARADEGRVEISRERFDIADLAGEIVRDIRPLAEAREISLVTDLTPVPVDADRARIRQLLVVLLDNSLKYTPAGGKVTVRTRRSGRRVELSVADTGSGIAPEHHERIFDRFYRVDTGRARVEGGTGLGLPIARWIAEVHGGQIGVESAVGRGTTFTVRLPGAP